MANAFLDLLDTYSGAKDVRSWWGDRSDPMKGAMAALAGASVLPWGMGLRGLRMAPDAISGGSGFGHSRGWWNVDDVPVLWDEDRAQQFIKRDISQLVKGGYATPEEAHENLSFLQGPAWEQTYRSPAEDLARQLAEFSDPRDPIIIKPDLYDTEQIMDLSLGEHTPQFTVEIPGADFINPTFGASRREGKWNVDDILNAGDPDFFGENTVLQDRYFGAIDRLTGADPEELIAIYRAMSPTEYDNWAVGQEIEGGKFFTDQPTAQYAADFQSHRTGMPELYGPFTARRGDLYQVAPNEYQTRGPMFYDPTYEGQDLVRPDAPLARAELERQISHASSRYDARQDLIRRFSYGVDPEELSAAFNELPELPQLSNPGAAAVDRVGKDLPGGMYRAGDFDPMDFEDIGYDSFRSRIPFLHQGGVPAEGVFASSPASLREVLETLGMKNASDLGEWMMSRRQEIGVPMDERGFGGWQTSNFSKAMEGVPMMSQQSDAILRELWGQTAKGPSSVVLGPRGLVHADVRAEYLAPKGYDAYNPIEGGIMMPRTVVGHNMTPMWEVPTNDLDYIADQAEDMDLTESVMGAAGLAPLVARPHFYANGGPMGWPSLLEDELSAFDIPPEDIFPWASSGGTSYADPRYMHPQLRKLARMLASMNIPFQG